MSKVTKWKEGWVKELLISLIAHVASILKFKDLSDVGINDGLSTLEKVRPSLVNIFIV